MFNTTSMITRWQSTAAPTCSRQAHFALVFHTVSGETVTTKHPINKDNQLCAGTVVDPIDVIHASLQAESGAANQPLQSQLLPARVLIEDHQMVMWHSKAQHRHMWFSGPDIGSVTLRVWWPNLLFKLDKRNAQLYVFALATGARPCATTPLYRAPLMNVNDNGSICLGSARLPKDQSSANIVEMEDCLYDSNFSHLNWKSSTVVHMADDKAHVAYYRKRDTSRTKFTARDLIRVGTLNDVL